MPNRYTIEELNKFSDYEMLYAIVKDRTETVTNCYSPLQQRLNQLLRKLDHAEKLSKPTGDVFRYPGYFAEMRRLQKEELKELKEKFKLGDKIRFIGADDKRRGKRGTIIARSKLGALRWIVRKLDGDEIDINQGELELI